MLSILKVPPSGTIRTRSNAGGTTIDVFPGKGSVNMLGIPAENALVPRGLTPVDRTAEHPILAQRRAREAAGR